MMGISELCVLNFIGTLAFEGKEMKRSEGSSWRPPIGGTDVNAFDSSCLKQRSNTLTSSATTP